MLGLWLKATVAGHRNRAYKKHCLLLSGVHKCFVCKKSGNGVKRCMIPLCGKFYHTDCIMAYSATQPHNKGFRCPLHVCLSCHITNPLSSCSKGTLRVIIPVDLLLSYISSSCLHSSTKSHIPAHRQEPTLLQTGSKLPDHVPHPFGLLSLSRHCAEGLPSVSLERHLQYRLLVINSFTAV